MNFTGGGMVPSAREVGTHRHRDRLPRRRRRQPRDRRRSPAAAGRHDVREEALSRDSGRRAASLAPARPRGKPALCVNLVTPPTRPDCDAGLIIMESTDYPPMSGSNTICTVTVLLETGMLPMREPVTTLTLDTPAGPVPVEARCRDGKVEIGRAACRERAER